MSEEIKATAVAEAVTEAGAEAKMALTEEMRTATRGVHDISDKLVNVKLLVALTKKELYGEALMLFYYVFAQIELSLQACKDRKELKGLMELYPVFARSDAIAKDLKVFLGDDWKDKYKPTDAVTAYVNRIKEVQEKNPVLLLSYSYHMYMALLAGGQMIRKMVSKSFELPAGGGLDTFDFKVKSRMSFRGEFKDKINAVEVDAPTKEIILKESVRVFQMNNKVVRSLDGTFNQFLLWLMKWIIVFMLLYWTYHLFVKEKPKKK